MYHMAIQDCFIYYRALNASFNYFWLLYLSIYEINNKPEIDTNWDWREIETNLQSQSQAFDCITIEHWKHGSVILTSTSFSKF